MSSDYMTSHRGKSLRYKNFSLFFWWCGSMDTCYGLMFLSPQNYIEILIPNVMVLGREVKPLGNE